MEDIRDGTLQRYARLTGFLYLFILALTTVSGQLADGMHVSGDFAATAANIREAELVYRTGLAMELAAAALVVPLAWSTYNLLVSVNRDLALLAMLWRGGEAVLGAVYTIFAFIAVAVYTGSSPSGGEAEAMARLLRVGVRHGFLFAVVYFSLGSALFFSLLLHSRFIPRLLALLGILASVWVTLFGLTHLLLPKAAASIGFAGWTPILAAELLTGLWLVVKGVDPRWWRERRPA